MSTSRDCWCGEHSIDTESHLESILTDASLPFDLAEFDQPLVIFGSRSLVQHSELSVADRRDLVVKHLGQAELAPDLIISGGADGGDAIAEATAIALGIPMIVFAVGSVSDGTSFRCGLADQPWAVETVTSYGDDDPDDPTTGRGAYMTRNCLMAALVARLGGHGLALWDGDSPGTDAMLDACVSHGIDHVVFGIPVHRNAVRDVRHVDTST